MAKMWLVAVMLSLSAAALRAQGAGPTGTSGGAGMAGAAAGAPENQEGVSREGGWAKRIESDLIAEKFDDLDRMADDYRRNKTRVAGGAWRLRQFYSVLDAPELTDKDSVEHITHLQHWMTARPESITARVALATSLHRWAWVARGNGLANTVTPEGWKLFDERAHEALVVLQGSQDMQPMCPQWYSEMMTVSLALNWDADREREIFERGVQFEPDYFYLYRQYANYLLPKWDGKPGEAVKFAKDSADKLPGDAGDELYFEIAPVLVKRGNGNFPVNEMDWARIERGAQVVIGKYGSVNQIPNELAFMAYKFGDAAAARQQFALIGDRWTIGVWRDREFFDRIRDWAQGQTQWPTTAAAQ
jgi:hypothetical protein